MKRFTFFCGPSLEPFSPKSSEQGRGGSEEMVIFLARELAKRNKVEVYNRCQEDEGTYDGVVYKNYDDFDVEETDVLIVWRSPELLFKYGLDKVKGKKYLWLHDVVPHLDILPYTFCFDGILTLSKWHKNYYAPLLKPEHQNRFIQTRNAVDKSLFNQKVERKPFTMVYGSLYDRGLEGLLSVWTKIKLAVPEAELRIFYGWETMEKLMGLEDYKAFKDRITKLMDQEGITHLGRISHKEVAKEMLGAQLWVYPTIFNEVSCITAMKAQIGGAVPVIFPKAALHETVKYGVKAVQGDNLNDLLESWSDYVIDCLNRPQDIEALRNLMMKNSDYSFVSLAKEWEKL